MSQQGGILVISGPSGSGKSTILNGLNLGGKSPILGIREIFPETVFSVSATTREPRPGEKHGIDYWFISDSGFQSMVNVESFLEHAHVHGRRYGTSARKVLKSVDDGKIVILDVDIQGWKQVKGYNFIGCAPRMTSIFIRVPLDQIHDRLKKRRMAESDIETRLNNAEKEMGTVSAEPGLYDYVIDNPDGQIEDTIAQVSRIVRATFYS